MATVDQAQTGVIGQQQGVDAQPEVGQMGDHEVRPGLGTRIKAAFAEFGTKVADFFKGIKTKYDNWQEGRAVNAARTEATQAASLVASDLGAGRVTTDTLKSLDVLRQKAERAGEDPAAMFKTAVESLPEDQKQTAVRADFDGMAIAMKGSVTMRLTDMAERWDTMHTLRFSNTNGDDWRSEITRQHGVIDTFMDGISGVASDIRNERNNHIARILDGVIDVDMETGHVDKVFDDQTGVPRSISGRLPAPREVHGPQHTFGSVIEETGKGSVGEITEYVEEKRLREGSGMEPIAKPTGVHEAGGTYVTSKAAGDWHRMNIMLEGETDTDGETYCTRLEGDTSDIPTRLALSADKMTHLTGSEKATTVLSGVLHQYQLREFVHYFDGEDGTVDLKPIPGGFERAIVELPDGNVLEFDNPGQIGDATLTVSRLPNGDYKIHVEWQYLSTRVDKDRNPELVDPEDSGYRPNTQEEASQVQKCLLVDMSGDIIVKGDAAREGRLEIDPSTELRRHVTGTITLDD